jgi:Flp pilus assembly pilin Flp
MQSILFTLLALKTRFDDLVESRERNERGAMAVEYALIAALMAALILAAVVILNTGITNAFTDIRDKLNDAIS